MAAVLGPKIASFQQDPAGSQVSVVPVGAKPTDKADGPGGPNGRALPVSGMLNVSVRQAIDWNEFFRKTSDSRRKVPAM